MRLAYTALVMITFAVGLQAQTYVVTPYGLRDADNLDKSYVVIDVEGKSAQELYDRAREYIIRTFKNPDLVEKGAIDNEYLRYNTYADGVTTIPIPLNNLVYGASYSVELAFKDGKVKHEVILLELDSDGNTLGFQPQRLAMGWWLYSKKGKLKLPKNKAEIEAYFESIVADLAAYLRGTSETDDDDW